MAPRSTRSKPAPPVTPEVSLPRLESNIDERRRLFILPRKRSTEARIISLPNPATASPNKYLFCPTTGLYEFTRITSSRSDPRSWLLGPNNVGGQSMESSVERGEDHSSVENQTNGQFFSQKGYVLKDADLFVATSIAPVFFALPILMTGTLDGKGSWRLMDDLLEALAQSSKLLERALQWDSFRNLLTRSFNQVCEVQDIGGEELYKPSHAKFSEFLMQRAANMMSCWPSSMEENLVRKQLEIPITSVNNVDSQESKSSSENHSGGDESPVDHSQDAQLPFADSLANESANENKTLEGESVRRLMRLRVALNFIMASYVDANLRDLLASHLSSPSSTDFKVLDTHLERVNKAKTEAQALRALSDNVSRKRGALDDEEAAEARAEKKRRKEEDEKRKKEESRAIKELKKVDTSGMKKLSSFFAKAPATPVK